MNLQVYMSGVHATRAIVSIASDLVSAPDTSSLQPSSDKRRLAVIHSIWVWCQNDGSCKNKIV